MAHDQMKFAVFLNDVQVYTSMYQYIPVCTSIYFEITKLE